MENKFSLIGYINGSMRDFSSSIEALKSGEYIRIIDNTFDQQQLKNTLDKLHDHFFLNSTEKEILIDSIGANLNTQVVDLNQSLIDLYSSLVQSWNILRSEFATFKIDDVFLRGSKIDNLIQDCYLSLYPTEYGELLLYPGNRMIPNCPFVLPNEYTSKYVTPLIIK